MTQVTENEKMYTVETNKIISCVGIGLISVLNGDGLLVQHVMYQVRVTIFHSRETIIFMECCYMVSLQKYGTLLIIIYIYKRIGD